MEKEDVQTVEKHYQKISEDLIELFVNTILYIYIYIIN
jgi:hypothetical protein